MPIVLNGSGPITGVTSLNTTVSDTEIGYLDGVTSALQTQLAGKADTQAAWQTFTPTYVNLTVGNGTTVARYVQIGKTVYGYLRFTLGSTSSVGTNPEFHVPVTQNSNVPDFLPTGNAVITDTGTENYLGISVLRTGSPATIRFMRTLISGSSAIPASITSTAPFTWTTSDILFMSFQYEAA